MTNICSNCGFKYDDDDIFCSRCGQKIVLDKGAQLALSIKQFEKQIESKFKQKTRFNNKNFDSVFGLAIFLITMLCALCLILYVILDKHHTHKETLQFNNLIQNPSQIPLLKEYSNYEDLSKNLKKVEDFLLLYLRNSSDNQDKKDKIFAAYLDELEKLPNLLNLKIDDIMQCKNRNSCNSTINSVLKDTGAIAYQDSDLVYLYPDYKYIANKFQVYLSDDLKKYVNLKAKYNYPISLNLTLSIKPIQLAQRIADFEELHLKTQNEFVKDRSEEALYGYTRRFIFTPEIYATTTQEMRSEFKNAYEYYVKKNKTSNLRPLMMSYLDKKRTYSEENFSNDYPYKTYDKDNFDGNIKKSTFEDVFVQLRKNIFTNKNIDLNLAYVYSAKNGKWKKYNTSLNLESGEYVMSEPDENNNVSIYNNVFSPMQELNILNHTKLYIISDGLYVFNQNKLSISKVTFNGKMFNTYTLNYSDITSLFPGIEVINIDSFQSYNVIIEKENTQANYIILSRYSQGWKEYVLEPVKGNYNVLMLPNMFNVNSNNDVTVLFKANNSTQEGFSEDKPVYKITIRTYGTKEQSKDEKLIEYDKKTQEEEEQKSSHTPNMMPKLKSAEENIELEDDGFLNVPEQKIEPPLD